MGTKRKQSKAEKTLEKILDGAIECYTRRGVSKTSLDNVAKTAGVGRTTLYRYVENRDDLLNKVVIRDAEQQQQEMSVLTRYHDDFASGMVDTVIYIMRGRRNRPLNALLFGSKDEALIDRVNLSPASFYAMTERLMGPLFKQAMEAGQIREGVTLEMASRWSARILLSLINYPEEFLEDEKALRDFLDRFLVPSLVRDQTHN